MHKKYRINTKRKTTETYKIVTSWKNAYLCIVDEKWRFLAKRSLTILIRIRLLVIVSS
jgi:hypothetical protein